MDHLRTDATWGDVERSLKEIGMIDERMFSIQTENRTEKGDLYITTKVTIFFPAGGIPKDKQLHTFAEADDMLKEVTVTRDSVFYGVNRMWLNATIAQSMTSRIDIKIDTHIPQGCLIKV